MRLFVVFLLVSICWATKATANEGFPVLTGHVVDEGHVLSMPASKTLEDMLADFENKSKTKIVVVTIESLEQKISPEYYGVELGRYWFRQGNTVDVLLIVLRKEGQIRVLDRGTLKLAERLTDAKYAQIIRSIILPNIRIERVEGGIIDGAKAIVAILNGEKMPAYSLPTLQFPESDGHIVDAAGALSNHTKSYLDQLLTNFEMRTQIHIVMSTLPVPENEMCGDYTRQYYTHWQATAAEKDNNLFYVLAFKNGIVCPSIIVGKELFNILPDDRTGSIIDSFVTPNIVSGKVDLAAEQGTTMIVGYLNRARANQKQ